MMRAAASEKGGQMVLLLLLPDYVTRVQLSHLPDREFELRMSASSSMAWMITLRSDCRGLRASALRAGSRSAGRAIPRHVRQRRAGNCQSPSTAASGAQLAHLGGADIKIRQTKSVPKFSRFP